MPVSPVEDAASALAAGGVVVVQDDEARENEADLVVAAEHATPATVAFFLEHTSGFLCTAITEEQARRLSLEPMVTDNTEKHGTAFLVSVDYVHGTTTGVSAADRAASALALADPRTAPEDLARPGHMLPLLARPGGVLKRAGHTEAGVELCRLAGLTPAALLCELVTPDRVGMLRGAAVERFAEEHGLPRISIASLVRRRRLAAKVVARSGEADVPTEGGTFRAVGYRSTIDGTEHLALVHGDVADGREVLVRVHSECLTGDLFGSLRCDCGTQLRTAMRHIVEAGRGVIVYLRGHEGRGVGLGHKLRAYELQQRLGLDTVDANVQLGLPVDTREYGVGAQILVDLGVRRMMLMTNNPHKYSGLEGYGLQIVSRVPLQVQPTRHNVRYLTAKRDRLGHLLDPPDAETS